MPSIPLTPQEEAVVIKTLGLQSIEDLFSTVPPRLRETADFQLTLGDTMDTTGRGLTEHELRYLFGKLSEKNATPTRFKSFLGGGYYDNIIPAVVNQLALRGEFLTCYTPYQPEVSQGTLQAIFEFQTLICRLTAMDVANASMYDGTTATAEAVLMARRITQRDKTDQPQTALFTASSPPEVIAVTKSFLRGHSDRGVEIPWTAQGTLDLETLKGIIDASAPYCLVVSSPNYFGILEPLDEIRKLLPSSCLLVVSTLDPTAYGIFDPPGHFGADIAVGEAHQFGTPLSFGGPGLGFFTAQKKYLRQMPGRLCGETKDSRGQRAYTLTLSTREQHIRREKATSNICTNQGLMALRATIYLSFLGKMGLVELSDRNYSFFDYLAMELKEHGIHRFFSSSEHYREGAFEIPNLEHRFQKALEAGIVPGIRLKHKFPKVQLLSEGLLISVNPKHTRDDLDALVEVLSHD